jgi:membrane protease YdiL (CAAX protease family)
MIRNSIPFMTVIDLLIIAVTIYTIWRCRLIGPSKRPSAPQFDLRLIVLGLVGVCLFYFLDLLSMYVLPVVEAGMTMSFMRQTDAIARPLAGR